MNPNWSAIGIHPIRKKTVKDDSIYVLGENGSLRTVRNGKKYNNYGSIDWVATEIKIRDIWYEGESRSIDKVGAMRDVENQTRKLLRLDKKRTGDELEDLDSSLKDRRLKDLEFAKKNQLPQLLTMSKADLKCCGLFQKIRICLNQTGLSRASYQFTKTSINLTKAV